MVIDRDGEELVDAPEVADRLGLKSSRQVLDLRVHRLGFPEPVGRQGRKLIWSWQQVENWSERASRRLPTGFFAEAAGGLSGRPRTGVLVGSTDSVLAVRIAACDCLGWSRRCWRISRRLVTRFSSVSSTRISPKPHSSMSSSSSLTALLGYWAGSGRGGPVVPRASTTGSSRSTSRSPSRSPTTSFRCSRSRSRRSCRRPDRRPGERITPAGRGPRTRAHSTPASPRRSTRAGPRSSPP